MEVKQLAMAGRQLAAARHHQAEHLMEASGLKQSWLLRRQVFMPFSLQLRHTKSGRHSGQDLRLQAPEIHALLDSREFLTFVDVVRYSPRPNGCHDSPAHCSHNAFSVQLMSRQEPSSQRLQVYVCALALLALKHILPTQACDDAAAARGGQA